MIRILVLLSVLSVVLSQPYVPPLPDCSTYSTETTCNLNCLCVWVIISNTTIPDLSGDTNTTHICADISDKLVNNSSVCRGISYIYLIIGIIVMAICGGGILLLICFLCICCGKAAMGIKIGKKRGYTEIPMKNI